MSGTGSGQGSAAVTTGNFIAAPPRLTGDSRADAQMQQKWLFGFYDQVIVAENLIGTLSDLRARVAALEAKVGK